MTTGTSGVQIYPTTGQGLPLVGETGALSELGDLLRFPVMGPDPNGSVVRAGAVSIADFKVYVLAGAQEILDATQDLYDAYDAFRFNDLDEILGDTQLTYVAGSVSTVSAGDRVSAIGLDLAYEVVAEAEADYDIATAGGVRLRVLPVGGAYPLRAFNLPASGDVSAHITAALARADGALVVGERGATYTLSNTVTRTGSAAVDFTGCKFFVDADTQAFNLRAEVFGPYELGSNYVEGDLSIDLTGDPLPAPPKEGTVMKIVSEALDPKNWSPSSSLYYRMAEFFVVGPGSTTTNIVLQRPIQRTTGFDPAGNSLPAYTTARTARVVFADNNARLDWTGGEIEYEDGHDGDAWNPESVILFGYIRPKVKDLSVSRAYTRCLALHATYQAAVSDVHFANVTDNTVLQQYGYGIDDAGEGTRVANISGDGVRHVYTCTSYGGTVAQPDVTRDLRSGRVRGAVIHAGFGTRGKNTPFDTHHQADGVHFSNLVVDGTDQNKYGAACRGQDVNFSNVKILSASRGLNAFTDTQLWTTDSTPADATHACFHSPHVVCDERAVNVQDAFAQVTGDGVFLSKDHTVLNCNGGTLRLTGRHEFKVTGAGTDNTPIIDCSEASAEAAPVLGGSFIVIDGDVIIDASEATASGISIFGGDSGCTIRVRGRLRVFAPAGASWKSGSVTVECEGNGVIEFSVEDAADNSIIANASALAGCNVTALDGSVRWRDPAFPKPQSEVFTFEDAHPSLVSHAGTGAEVNHIYTPGGQKVFDLLDQRGEGHITLKMSGIKLGTTGAATLNIRDYDSGEFIAGVTIAAADIIWSMEVRIDIAATGAQEVSGTFINGSGGTSTVKEARSAETLTPAVGARPFSLSINAAVGDTVTVKRAQVFASAGGVF